MCALNTSSFSFPPFRSHFNFLLICSFHIVIPFNLPFFSIDAACFPSRMIKSNLIPVNVIPCSFYMFVHSNAEGGGNPKDPPLQVKQLCLVSAAATASVV
jgi:hypothetical protein